MLGLAEDSGELESLADGGGLEVEILLLDVASLPLMRKRERGSALAEHIRDILTNLEAAITSVAVDKDISRDDSHGDTRGENIEESGLSSSK